MKKKHFLLGLAALLLPLTVGAKDVTLTNFIITLPDNFVYNGGETQPTFIVKAINGTQLEKDTQYTISYEFGGKSATTIKDAGNYTIKVKGAGILSGYDEESTTFTVEKRPVTIELENGVTAVEKTYGQQDSEVDFAKYFVIGNLATGDAEADAVGCLTLERVNDQNDSDYNKDDVREKPYRVALKAKTDADGNYTYNPTGINYIVDLKINPKPLILVFEKHVYTGKEYKADELESKDYKLYTKYTEGATTGNEEFTTPTLNITFEAEANTKLLNVGPYTLTATITDNDNYQIGEDGTVTFNISKAALTIAAIEGKDFNGYYGYNNPVDFTSYFTYKVDEEDIEVEDLGLTMKREDNANVGTYPISPYVGEDIVKEEAESEGDLTYETALQNYEISFEGADFVINKKAFSTTTDFTYTVNEDADLTYQGKVFEVPNDFLSIKYNTYYNGEDKEKGKDLVYDTDYTLEVVPATGGTAKNAGETFQIKVVGKGNFHRDLTLETTHYATPLEKDFTITKAALEIIAPENASVLSKVYDGKEIGDVTNLYTFEGLVGEDVDENGNIVEGKVLKMFSSQTEANASYIVHVIDVADNSWPTTTGSNELKNYTFKYDEIQTKKFTILAVDFELDGSKEDDSVENLIAAYNGKEVSSVTVKNLMNFVVLAEDGDKFNWGGKDRDYKFEENNIIKAEQWYTLALPFDVTVRELSEQLGYAIVNIPNTSNTDGNKIVFKLTMQTVPANTLMAFKVDEDIEWNENRVLTFGSANEPKTIVAPTEEYSVENGNADEAGNRFVSVYKKETIEDEQDWFLLTYNGTFYSADKVEDGFNVYPMNGYVHFEVPATEGIARTISMENPDGTTSVINVATDRVVNSNAEGWYTVGGIKLNGEPAQKGIYINNGKKVVIK